MAVYYASKAYVLSFSEALANELRGSGINVSALCPGPTRTEFQRRAGIKTTKLFDWLTIDPQTVAEIAYRSMMKNRTVIIPGFTNNVLALSVRFLPRNLVTEIVRRMQDPKAKTSLLHRTGIEQC